MPALLRRPAPRVGPLRRRRLRRRDPGPADARRLLRRQGRASPGLVRALAVELGGTGITANAVSPGSTDTPVLAESARLYGLGAAEDFAAQQPLGRLLEPAEVARALVWLAGEGSGAVTGAVLPVDGGLAL